MFLRPFRTSSFSLKALHVARLADGLRLPLSSGTMRRVVWPDASSKQARIEATSGPHRWGCRPSPNVSSASKHKDFPRFSSSLHAFKTQIEAFCSEIGCGTPLRPGLPGGSTLPLGLQLFHGGPGPQKHCSQGLWWPLRRQNRLQTRPWSRSSATKGPHKGSILHLHGIRLGRASGRSPVDANQVQKSSVNIRVHLEFVRFHGFLDCFDPTVP